MKNYWMTPIIRILFFAFWLCSCKTMPEAEDVTGHYVDDKSGEFLEFLGHGIFRYNILADAQPTEIYQKPPYTGKYKLTEDGDIKISPISIHLGLFTVGLSEDKDKLFVKHRFSGRESVLQKSEP